MPRLLPLALLVFLAPAAPVLSGCDGQQAGTCPEIGTFQLEDITPADVALGDASASGGSCVTVDYVGRLADGSGVFEEGRKTLAVITGRGETAGLILGINGLRVNQTRRVTVPARLGYGGFPRAALADTSDRGTPLVGIPACSVLEYDVTLVRVNQDTRLCGL